MAEVAAETRIVVGAVYRFVVVTKDGDRPGHRYRVLNFGRCGRTMQVQVYYEGLTGPDRGLWFNCPTHDFAVKFVPDEKAPAPVAVEAAVAGPVAAGKGF